MKIPFVDLNLQYHSIKNEIDLAISAVINETAFIGGKYVTDFEKQFAEKYGVKHVISCANGTDSLYIILKMLGIGDGHEVLTGATSWISSSETITQAGATVVFVDTHPDYYTLNEDAIEDRITTRTKAIVAVHLQGQMCEMSRLLEICKKHSIYLIEDCAQSHFSEYDRKKAGLFGIAGSFSFYPGKNLGAYGDAGCIITNDDILANRIRMFARHGALKKHQHEMEGINSRMDGLQAAILSAKLPFIDEWTDLRVKKASLYNELLAGIDKIQLPKIRKNTRHTFHLYVIQCEERDELSQHLKSCGVESAIHYPTALPNLWAYKYLNHSADDFPVASRLQNTMLSLPMFPELTEAQIAYTANCIKQFYC